jgi:hypothetical protein
MNWKSLIALPLLVSALLVGAACSTISLGQMATPKHAEYSAPAHAAASASVTLYASPEDITLKPLASGSENYFEAQIDYIGTITYAAEAHNDDPYTVSLTENANNLNYSGAPLKWDISIDPAVPLALEARSSSGALVLDLSEFTLTTLKLDTSSGGIDATLPATDQQYDASITTSSGIVTATVEDGAQIDFTAIESSSGSLTLNAGNESSLSASFETSSGRIGLNFGVNTDAEITVSNSSGAITVDVPEGAALRLEIVENSSGRVTVPGWLQQVSGDDEIGVWETDGYNTAEHQISIVVTRNSSGAVMVQ